MHAPEPRTGPDWAIVIPFGIVSLVWGTTWYVIKTQLGVVPAQWSVAYRFLTASLIMFAVCAAMRRPMRFPPRAHLFFLVVGLFQFTLNFTFVYQASRFITSGLIAVVFALLVVPNALFGRIFLGQHVTRPFLIGSGLGIAGVTLLFRQEFTTLQGSPELVLGIGATLIGVLAASVANVMQATPRAKGYDIYGMLAWSMLYGACIDSAVAWALTGPPVVEATPLYVGGVLYLAALASALAFLLYFSIIRRIGPAKAAYSSVIVPFVAMTISTLLEGYRWTPLAVLGAVLTVIGLIIALKARKVPAGAAAAGGTTGRT